MIARRFSTHFVVQEQKKTFKPKVPTKTLFSFSLLNILNSIFECKIYAILFRMPEGIHFILVSEQK